MDAFTSLWNQLMSLATFAGIAISIGLLSALLTPKSHYGSIVLGFVRKYILGIGLLVSLAAMLSSLVYSNVIGYEPCLLCWYARIALYPQVLLFAIALYRRDRGILDYALGLTIFGTIITGYHTWTNIVGYSPLPCPATVSCLTRYVYEYGFITIPLMGFVGCLVLLLSILTAKRGSKISV